MEIIEFESWTEFRSWIDNHRQDIAPVYWRGQKKPEWQLASSFERELTNEDAPPQRSLFRARLNQYLETFKQASAGRRGANPATLDDDQWWVLGRHFGLLTPLLDWTDSPYIAAFFAISERLPEIQTPIGLGRVNTI
ncbi:MAG: FRG domain-containing protein [Burkholderiales bacterium]